VAPDTELPKFVIRFSDGLSQFVGVPGPPAVHRVPVVGNQVRPHGQLCSLLDSRLVSVEGGFFGEVPAFPTLRHPQRSGFAGARPAHRFDGGPAGHGHVAQLPGVRVADFHRERPHAYPVLIRYRRDDIGG
jgi:hypothetical protein